VLRGFQLLLPTSSWVIRDGHKSTICAEELVVGDLVLLRSGARVPADVRMLSCNGLKLETSSISGEAEPIEFTCESAAKSITVFESHNVAFNGSFCVDGEGLGVVIRVADNTVGLSGCFWIQISGYFWMQISGSFWMSLTKHRTSLGFSFCQ
jgi:sodium/potassium-transporting ATPase subunit alpha